MIIRLMLIAIVWSIIVFTFLKLWSRYLASVDGATTKNSQLNQKNLSNHRQPIERERSPRMADEKTNRLYGNKQ